MTSDIINIIAAGVFFIVIDATSCGATYSCRSNAIGSIFVARNAGKKQANNATPIK